MINVTSHRRPIDLYDAATGEWYQDLLQHHAGSGFMAAGVGNKLAVIGGWYSPDTVFSTHDKVTIYEWKPFDYPLLDCTAGENQDCYSCLVGNAHRNLNPCRWCYNPDTSKGSCKPTSLLCLGTDEKMSLLAGQGSCPSPPPTPPPNVLYHKRCADVVVVAYRFSLLGIASPFSANLRRGISARGTCCWPPISARPRRFWCRPFRRSRAA